jgi:hypothetical protein
MVVSAHAQTDHLGEPEAKEAVHRIVSHSGLLPTFTVREDPQLRTANAYIKGHERVIAYNPAFIASIVDSSGTNWAAVSILAHEIAHHLLGHTLDPEAMHPGDELACDRYSGFILNRMGASLPESLAAIEVAGNVHGTRSHPPKHARATAIRQGWEEARDLAERKQPAPYAVDRMFQFVVHFAGDPNTYYVDQAGCLVWFNNFAEPIEFGACTRLAAGEYDFALDWTDQQFAVDHKGNIWNRTASGMLMNVGRMQAYRTP